MARQFTVWETVVTPHGHCSVAVIDQVVYVRSALGQKATQLGGSCPQTLAHHLMAELHAESAVDA